MNPARTLEEALSAMTFEVIPGRFLLAGFPEAPTLADLEALDPGPGQIIQEGGETTLLVPAGERAGVLARHPRAQLAENLVWIRFRAPMSWEVVGFLAHVTGALAEAGVSLGAICGFSRDHLFLDERALAPTLGVLTELFAKG